MIHVVGGGVFGQVIAARLRKDGHAVTVYDRREKEAGSLPSGGHLKPSWLTDIPRGKLEKALETLDSLFGLQKLICQAGLPPLVRQVELLRLDVERILASPVIETNVTKVGNGWLECADGERREGVVIVAAGVWCKQLLPKACASLTAKKGISWLFSGVKNPHLVPNVIRPWAPYKQIVRTHHGPERIWIGDGSAILPQNWNDKIEQRIEARVMPLAPPEYRDLTRQRGLRPYIDREDSFQRVDSKLWLATGGAKSGSALAGVVANQLAEILK